jgi:predicted signal transduction protein with EAL and GGDEF domain
MYYARAEGNAGHKVADSEMRARIQRRAAIASLLPAALRRNGLRVLFQPIVELGSRRTVGWRRSFVGNTPTWAR